MVNAANATAKVEKSENRNTLDVNALGGGIKILGKEEVKLTPTLANKFLEDLVEFQGERNLREHWADHLAQEMKRGTFRFEHVILAQASLEGQEYRVNGQHCCWARLEHADDPKYSQPVALIRYRVETEEDLRNLYSAFDQHGRRSRGHVVMAQLVGFQGWSAVAKKFITLVSQGFPLWKWDDSAERKQRDTRDHAFLLKTEFLDLGVKVGAFLTQKSGNAKHLHRAPVVAAMLGTFAKNASASEEFWVPVAEGTGFAKASDPRNKLRAELLSAAVGAGGKNGNKKNLTQEEMLRMCIHSWNAFRAGEDRVNLKAGAKGSRPKFR